VISLNSETRRQVGEITAMFATLYKLGQWVFGAIGVLGISEKARQKDVLVPLMLVNDTPDPVLELLGGLSRVPSVTGGITTQAKGIGLQNITI
jgi:hypothetical protein